MGRVVKSKTLTGGTSWGKLQNTPFMSASDRFILDNDINRNGETRNDEDFKDGDFPALKPNYDRREHAHHMVTGHNAPENSFAEYLIGPFQTQKTHYRNNSLNRRTRKHTFNLTTHCHWLNKTKFRVRQPY